MSLCTQSEQYTIHCCSYVYIHTLSSDDHYQVLYGKGSPHLLVDICGVMLPRSILWQSKTEVCLDRVCLLRCMFKQGQELGECYYGMGPLTVPCPLYKLYTVFPCPLSICKTFKIDYLCIHLRFLIISSSQNPLLGECTSFALKLPSSLAVCDGEVLPSDGTIATDGWYLCVHNRN